jgi:hypothetical protein
MAATFPAQGVQFSALPGTDPSVVPLTSGTQACNGTSALITTITEPSTGPVVVTNGSGATVYLGDSSSVTTSNGYALAINTSVLVTYGPPTPTFGGATCTLYGITSGTSSTVTYLAPTTWPPNIGY